MPKVTTVKIDKKNLMEQVYNKKGLSELLSNVNLTIDVDDKKPNIMKKFVSAVKRTFKPDFLKSSREDKISYFSKVNIFDVYQIKIEEVTNTMDDAFKDYIKRLIKMCSTLKETKEEPDIVKVIIQNGKEQYEGFSLLNGEVKTSYHRSGRRISGVSKYGYSLLFDLPSLVAETIVVQSLIKFLDHNREVNKLLFVKSNLNQLNPVSSRIPIDGIFQDSFLEIANKYGLDYSKATKSENLNKKAYIFYGDWDVPIGNKNSIICDEMLRNVIVEFIEQSNYAKYKVGQMVEERSNYAKSFQTKSQIKLTHQDRMKNNSFLTHYGFVELDNDVDLKKFNVIEENFIELTKKLSIPSRKDYSFRIKKLGKHRAAGIFYPSFKTTIFDLNHPDAYIHECFHQIDCILGEKTSDDYLSETIEFRTILDDYKELVTKAVKLLSSDDSFKKVWGGKTKYNKAYYFTPTEVFARTGEIYISQKGLGESSLFKEEKELKTGAVYPFDESFVKRVVSFYDKLFTTLKAIEPQPLKEQKLQQKKRLNITDEWVAEHYEQIQLF